MAKALTLDELKGLVRARVTANQSQLIAARELGVSPQVLNSLLLYAHRKPGPMMLRALGYRRVEMYQKVKP